ncbi:MAG: exo-alpha-sialidase [Candidatus Aminicenantes bacterium]|nr:exo-alpha-sialidase [Candidatus Aminicenantes bacterium]
MKRIGGFLAFIAISIGAFMASGMVVDAGAAQTAVPTPASAGPGQIPGRDFAFVCHDAGAGGYEAFPDVCRLRDGRLMSVFYAGYDHVSLPTAAWPKGGRIAACFSSDEGRTWSKPSAVFDGPDDDRDPSIVQLASGRLLCNFFTLRAKPGDPKAWDGLGTWLVESDDLGRTWSSPRRLSADYYCSSPIRILPGGRLMLGLYKQEKDKAWGAVIASDDSGRTWGPVVDIPNGGWKLDAETDVVPLKDGTILAVEREPSTTMCASISADGGRTWSVSKPMGFPGHCPYLFRAPGDILLLAHRLPQTSLHYSLDEGKSWSADVLVDDCLGAYPSMAPLKDGSVLIVYYEEGAGSNIRARRFRAEEGGITWLSVADGAPVEGASIAAVGAQAWRGSPSARISRRGDVWTIAGSKRTVEVDAASLALKVRSGGTDWATLPSFDGDLVVRRGESDVKLRLASASGRAAGPYDTGFQAGVRIELKEFKAADAALDTAIQLFVGLDGIDEDLVCRIVAADGADRIRELLWPAAVDPAGPDFAVVPFMQGMLLPRDWPRKVWLYDSMSYGRGLYMPWWGFQRGSAAAAVILETPDDAGCRFEHPAGGPTRIDVRWVHSLGRFAYPRSVRFAFLDRGNYVDLAKRYRRHVIERGRFVSLKEKIARNPLVARLVGAPVVHTSILYHIQPQSSYYDRKDPAKNHQLVSFDARAAELRALAGKGIGRAYVHLDGWGVRGYDNLHPDILPPNPEAGGWDGMRRFSWACDTLGFIFAVHDQYRDFYLDAPSYTPRNAQIEEDGKLSTHGTWYGGMQTYLCPSLAPGNVRKNYGALLDRGIKVRGAYLDVFAVVPPDECYNPEHPVTRTECLRYRGEAFDVIRSRGGVVSSEEPADWAVPKLDLVHHGPFALDPNPGSGPAMGIPVPLFNLVYHDSILLPWSLGKGAWGIPETDLGFLHGLGHAGLPYLSLDPSAAELEQVRTMCALNARVGLLELVRHEFLDGSYRRQRFTYADGTTVTIDLDSGGYDIAPRLEVPAAIK